MRTLALERLLAHVARAGEAMGRPGAIPRSDGHITTRGEVLGPARPSSRIFRKSARNAEKQTIACRVCERCTNYSHIPPRCANIVSATVRCPNDSHHHASRVSFDGHERYGSGNCPDLCVAFSVCSRAGRVSC